MTKYYDIIGVIFDYILEEKGIKYMRLISIHLPQESLQGLDELVRLQRYPNRSEAIRFAIRDLLKAELWAQKNRQTRIIRE